MLMWVVVSSGLLSHMWYTRHAGSCVGSGVGAACWRSRAWTWMLMQG